MTIFLKLDIVILAKAGNHPAKHIVPHQEWIPAFAGKTKSIFVMYTGASISSPAGNFRFC
jgi:hypothetical protein